MRSGQRRNPALSLKRTGFHAHILFLSLDSADLAIERVAARVRLGGHDVPAAVVRRRYERGLHNFLNLYFGVVDSWQLFDNSGAQGPRLIAAGKGTATNTMADAQAWQRLVEQYRD